MSGFVVTVAIVNEGGVLFPDFCMLSRSQISHAIQDLSAPLVQRSEGKVEFVLSLFFDSSCLHNFYGSSRIGTQEAAAEEG